MLDRRLKGVVIGAGYFSEFHLDGWARIPEVEIVAISNRTIAKAEARQRQFRVPRCYADYRAMIDQEKPDFVDIITSPGTHYEICDYASQQGLHIICQKPLAPSYEESQTIVNMVFQRPIRFMVHENWRWQPWYREIADLLRRGVLGEPFSLYFRMRTGDGWGEDAYLDRQPFFRDYPRLLVFETGVHFIDTFRFLFGQVRNVFARLRRLNPVIQGEDSGQILLTFDSGVCAIWDANRYNESAARDLRYTFGELRLDASKGHLSMDTEGRIHIKLLGKGAFEHNYTHTGHGFGSDCCYRTERHFVECLLSDQPFETNGPEYLQTLRVVEACYQSAAEGQVVQLSVMEGGGRAQAC